MDPEARRHSPAAERNSAPLLAELLRLLPAERVERLPAERVERLPAQGTVLEIASGTGQHAAFFARGLPGWRWQPSDGDVRSLASIAAWCDGIANVLPPLHLDLLSAAASGWPGVPAPIDAVFCANLIHISPWATTPALMQGAALHLAPQGLLLLYGPYIVDGQATAPSNEAFDADLRARDPDWGLRRLAEVQQEAAAAGLLLTDRVAMPANNLLLVFTRQ